jgi:hypothetical protein
MGLVMAYFHRSGRFGELGTRSMRFWPRPADDKYADERVHPDPGFTVLAGEPA